MDKTLKSLQPLLKPDSCLNGTNVTQVTRLGAANGNDDDMIFARALLEQSLQVAAETYGAASLLVGGSSDEGECEDIAVVVESKQMGEAEWETIVEQLGLQSGKLSEPRSESVDVAKLLERSQSSGALSDLGSFTKATRYEVSSEDEGIILAMLVFRRPNTGNWIILLGCGPIFE